MVAVYNTFGEVEAARPARDGFKKYAGALAGAWAVLFVAAVMIIGEWCPFCSVSLKSGAGRQKSCGCFFCARGAFESQSSHRLNWQAPRTTHHRPCSPSRSSSRRGTCSRPSTLSECPFLWEWGAADDRPAASGTDEKLTLCASIFQNRENQRTECLTCESHRFVRVLSRTMD
eukprot:3271650-Rhodomonas_salina.2